MLKGTSPLALMISTGLLMINEGTHHGSARLLLHAGTLSSVHHPSAPRIHHPLSLCVCLTQGHSLQSLHLGERQFPLDVHLPSLVTIAFVLLCTCYYVITFTTDTSGVRDNNLLKASNDQIDVK